MYTSIVLVALVGAGGIPESAAQTPQWHRDYFAARKLISREHKPLAVFVGRGESGWDDRSKEGELSKEAKNLLDAHYICVYVDTTKAEGRQLADSFDLKEGLVLSDGSGDQQAFRHEGSLSNPDLEKHLRKFSDPDRVPVKTETTAAPAVRYYEPPVPQPSPFASPGGYYPGFGSSRRGC